MTVFRPAPALAVLLIGVSCADAQSELARETVPCTAIVAVARRPDAALADRPREQFAVRGKEQFALLQFRFGLIAHRKLAAVTLRVHQEDTSRLAQLGLAAIPLAWDPLRANYAESSPGAPWAGGKVTLADLLWKAQNRISAAVPVAADRLGWLVVRLPQELLDENVRGRKFGIALFGVDRNEHKFSNTSDRQFAPVLEAELAPE